MEKRINHYNRVSAVFFMAVGLFFSLYGRTVEVGSWSEPGPGFLPFWSGLVLVGMSLLLLLGSFKRREWQAMPPFFPLADSWRRVVLAFVAMAAYLLLLNPLGFTLVTFLFIAFLLKVIFPQNWKRTLIGAAVTAVLARAIFVSLLETQLPRGFIGF